MQNKNNNGPFDPFRLHSYNCPLQRFFGLPMLSFLVVCSSTYLGCSIFYQFSNDVESKLAKFLQLIGTIKRTILRKVRTETILKI